MSAAQITCYRALDRVVARSLADTAANVRAGAPTSWTQAVTSAARPRCALFFQDAGVIALNAKSARFIPMTHQARNTLSRHIGLERAARVQNNIHGQVLNSLAAADIFLDHYRLDTSAAGQSQQYCR